MSGHKNKRATHLKLEDTFATWILNNIFHHLPEMLHFSNLLKYCMLTNHRNVLWDYLKGITFYFCLLKKKCSSWSVSAWYYCEVTIYEGMKSLLLLSILALLAFFFPLWFLKDKWSWIRMKPEAILHSMAWTSKHCFYCFKKYVKRHWWYRWS